MRLLSYSVFLLFAFYFSLFQLPSSSCAQEEASPPARQTCRTSSSSATSQNAAKPNTVTAPTLADDWLNSEILMRKTMPSELNKEIESTSSSATNSALPKIGVERGFISNLLCAASDIFSSSWFGGILRSYCEQDLQIAGEYSNSFVEKAKTLAKASQPENLEKSPEEQDCFIAEDPKEEPEVQGNTDLDEVSTSLGTPVGVYGGNIPKFEGVTPDLKDNIQLNGKTFEEDKRVPDINERCAQYSKANYPEGISICE